MFKRLLWPLFTVSSKEAVSAVRLRALYDLATGCWKRYSAIPKYIRIGHGLRPDIGDPTGYFGGQVADAAIHLLGRAFRGEYPIHVHPFDFRLASLPERLDNNEEVVRFSEPQLAELDARLTAVEALSAK